MQYLAEKAGMWFEGAFERMRLINPTPMVLPLNPVSQKHYPSYLFREDYFNSVTRIRRGTVYQPDGSGKNRFSQFSMFPYPSPSNGAPIDKLYTVATEKFEYGEEVILGNSGSESHWMVVLSERNGLNDHFLTLRSKTFLGVLPELRKENIPEESRDGILSALEAVVSSATIASPQPVIDACRIAATELALGKENLGDIQKELGKIINELRKRDVGNNSNKESCVQSVYNVVNRLHSRAKPSGQANNGTRPVSQRDADLAVSAIAFLLQEYGWAELY